MLQRFTGPYPVDFPTLNPPVQVHPGDTLDHPELLAGFVAVDGDVDGDGDGEPEGEHVDEQPEREHVVDGVDDAIVLPAVDPAQYPDRAPDDTVVEGAEVEHDVAPSSEHDEHDEHDQVQDVPAGDVDAERPRGRANRGARR